MNKVLCVLLALCVLVATNVNALEMGDPAPEIQIKGWVKGDAVKLSELKGKKVVVLEFWATWCGPCIKGIPHLTELQEQYKDDVVVIGVRI